MGRKAERSKYEKEKERKRNNQRSEVEGKFGEAKNRYGMDRLHTRLPQTTNAEISLIFLAVNLVQLLRKVGECSFLAPLRAGHDTKHCFDQLFFGIIRKELYIYSARVHEPQILMLRGGSF